MTPEEIRSATMASFCASWATCTVIDLPNQPFTAPKNAAWVKPRMRFSQSFELEIGVSGAGLRTGTIMVETFVRAGSGTKTGLTLAGRVEAIFRRKDLSGVLCKEPSTDETGVDEDTGAYRFLTNIDFEAFVGE